MSALNAGKDVMFESLYTCVCDVYVRVRIMCVLLIYQVNHCPEEREQVQQFQELVCAYSRRHASSNSLDLSRLLHRWPPR